SDHERYPADVKCLGFLYLYVGRYPRNNASRNTQLQDSVIRRIEIIGEAARRVSPVMRERYPQIPWSEMVSMRNRMIHEYDDIDLPIVWNTVQQDLPALLRLIEPLVPPKESR
ncbi:MAG: Uncharacterized conserved protein, contains HEPN domain, partial [Candidatus Kentron sp. G]